MSTLLETRRKQFFKAKAAMQEHSYFGSHNVWYGETVHECECGFESHEKAEVEQHVEAQNKENEQ